MFCGKNYKDMSVTFYDVIFHCQLKIDAEDVLRFKITMQHGSNRFELVNGNTQIVTGSIKNGSNIDKFKCNIETDADVMQLSGQDIYTLLRMKGYSYGKDFQNIHELNSKHDSAYIKWTGEWATFLDSLLQLNILTRDYDGVSTPKIIKKLIIDVDGHKIEDTTVFDHVNCYKADISKSTDSIRCGGVEVSGVVFDDKLTQDKQPDVLLVREFVPHELEDSVPFDIAILISLQLVADNIQSNKLKLVELLGSASKAIFSIEDISIKLPFTQIDVNIVEIHDNNINVQDVIDSNLLVARNLLGRKKMVNIMNQVLDEGTFVLTLEQTKCNLQNTDFKVILTMPVDSGVLVLMKKESKYDEENVTYIRINQDSQFSWLPKVLNELNKTRRVVFVSERQPQCGLLGLIKHLRKYGKHNIGLVVVDDYTLCFDPLNPICKEQLNKRLAYNVLKKAAMKCVTFMGRFLDVSNVDIEANRDFRMFFLEEDKHYEVVNISYLFKPENLNERKVLQSLMAKGIANGTVRPLSRVVYSPLEVSRAFKLLSSSRHIGRALIRMSASELLSSKLNVTPRVTFSNGVHVIICDTNNLGIELTSNLIKKGGTKIVLHLKKKSTKYFYARVKLNVTIELNSENLQTASGCEKLLKAGQKLGSVTSIFIMQDYKENVDFNSIDQDDFQSSYDETVRVTANLDIASRSSCHELRNFVIVSALSQNIGSDYATSACETICEDRKKVGLPALVLRTIFPKKIIQNKTNLLLTLEESTLSSLFNAMDISLKCKYTNALIFNLPKITTSDVSKKIQRILGAQGVNCDEETVTLYEMNVNDMIIDELKSEMSQITNFTTDLGEMTVANLKNLCSSYERKHTMFGAGLGAFYYNIKQKEYKVLEAYFHMKTQLIRSVGNEYLDRSKNELFMIPGFDGHHQIFKSVAERLKIRATALELGPDIMYDSIPEIAVHLKNIIVTQFATYPKFYILGYSFGVNVALEVAKLLETEGRTGVVYCLDSSPDALKSQLKAYLGNVMDAQLQDAILVHMYNLMTGQDGVELKQELEKTDSWSDKIEICMKRLQGLAHFSIGHRRSILESAYKKILLANEYEPDFKLESELVLIKGIPHPKADSLAEDYNLSKYTKQPVKVFHIESDHVAAPYDNRVSNFVNKMLDPNVLEEFKGRKLC